MVTWNCRDGRLGNSVEAFTLTVHPERPGMRYSIDACRQKRPQRPPMPRRNVERPRRSRRSAPFDDTGSITTL
jgi:hypothetical protein